MSISDLLSETKVEVAPATYTLVGLTHLEWSRLLESPELSPNSDVPFMVFRDQFEVTLLVEDDDWRRIRHAARDAKVETGFRLVTLNLALPWNVVGYLASVTELLSSAGISVGALTAFSRDHLLIKQDHLGKALRVLGQHVKELC